jgi:hypothetical protein
MWQSPEDMNCFSAAGISIQYLRFAQRSLLKGRKIATSPEMLPPGSRDLQSGLTARNSC